MYVCTPSHTSWAVPPVCALSVQQVSPVRKIVVHFLGKTIACSKEAGASMFASLGLGCDVSPNVERGKEWMTSITLLEFQSWFFRVVNLFVWRHRTMKWGKWRCTPCNAMTIMGCNYGLCKARQVWGNCIHGRVYRHVIVVGELLREWEAQNSRSTTLNLFATWAIQLSAPSEAVHSLSKMLLTNP